MRLLIGWDDPEQAELVSMYLNVDGTEAVITTDPQEFVERAAIENSWDAFLMTSRLPDLEGAVSIFERLTESRTDVPIVAAVHLDDTYRLARFITRGLRSYVIRDLGGDFMFLLRSTLEGTVEAFRNERENRAAEQMRQEIESVRKFQESILPDKITAPVGYNIAASYEPTQIAVVGTETVVLAGGDYYEVLDLDEKTSGILFADATGHGMTACLTAMSVHTIMHGFKPKKLRKPESLVRELNRQFCELTVCRRLGGLISLSVGVLKAKKHTYEWSSAGQPFPLLFDTAKDQVTTLSVENSLNSPVGIDPEMRYGVQKVEMPVGGRLLLYSDGLSEAAPQHDSTDQYGIEGITATLRRTAQLPLADAMQALYDDSYAYTQGYGRHDDTSVMLIERCN